MNKLIAASTLIAALFATPTIKVIPQTTQQANAASFEVATPSNIAGFPAPSQSCTKDSDCPSGPDWAQICIKGTCE